VSRLRREIATAVRGLPATFWWLWAGILVNSLAQFVFPFLALYLVRRGFSVAGAGLLVSLMGAGAVLSGPLGGFLTDRVGRRPTLVSSLVLAAVTVAAMSVVRAPAAIAAGVAVLGVVSQMFRPAAQATVADLVPPAERARAYGLNYWAMNIGFAVSMVVGGALAEVSFTGLFLADAATTLLFAGVVFWKVPETRPPEAAAAARVPLAGGLGAPLRDGAFARLLALNLAFAFILLQFNVAAPIDMARHGISPAQYGMLMALNGVVIVLLQPFAARMTGGRDPSRVLALAAVLVGAGYGLFGVLHTPVLYGIAIVIWTLGEICHTPVSTALVANMAPVAERGRYQGALGMSWGLATFLAPALGSLVMDRLGPGALWGGCLGLGLLAAAGQLASAPGRRARPRAFEADRPGIVRPA
jgi:MFS family permease